MVGNYSEIEAKMEQGTINRTVASTNMNATSSRAHTIVGINFVQKTKNNAGKEMAKGSMLYLVDLAGRYGSNSINLKHLARPGPQYKSVCYQLSTISYEVGNTNDNHQIFL